MVAVPWAVYSPSSDLNVLTVTVDRDRIYNAPVFDYARIEEYSRPDYITNVYSYYGVSSGAAVGVGVSGGTSTTTSGATTTTGTTTATGAATGANTTAGAAASPAAGASVEGSPAPNTTEGRRAHPGAAAAAGAAAVMARETATPTPYGRAGSSPSKERTPSAKQKQQTPSSRGKRLKLSELQLKERPRVRKQRDQRGAGHEVAKPRLRRKDHKNNQFGLTVSVNTTANQHDT